MKFTNEAGKPEIGKIIVTFAAVLIAVIVVFGSVFTVDQGERGVVLRNGKAVSSADAGLNFKYPLIESVRRFEIRTHKLSFDKISVYSKDIQAADIQIQVNFRPDATKLVQIYSNLGEGYAERVLWPNLLRETKEVFGRYAAADIINARDRLGADVTQGLTNVLAPYNIIVESVQIVNVDFSDVFEKSIEARMQAEVEVQQQRQILEKQKVQAENTKVTADANAYAVQKKAEADAFQIRATMAAEAEGINKRGAALRDNPSLVDLVKAEKWNGVLPTTMLPNTATPFLTLK